MEEILESQLINNRLELKNNKVDINIKNYYMLSVHGVSHSAWCFDLILRDMKKKKYLCYAMSLRDHGNSVTYNKKITFDDYVEDLKEIIDYLHNIHGKYPILIGHSMGSAIVQYYIYKYYENKIPAIIYITPMIMYRTLQLKQLWNMPLLLHKFTFNMVLNFNIESFFKPENLKMLFFNHNTKDDILIKYGKKLRIEPYNIYRILFEGNVYPYKHDIPMYFISAEFDKLFTPKIVYELYSKYKELNKTVYYTEIKNSGHDIMLDNEFKTLSDNIEKFIKKLDTSN